MEPKDIRLAIVGEAGVGKSAMAVRFITGRFLHHYNPTLEDEYSCKFEADGRQHNLIIMDTAGQEKDNLRFYFKNSDALLLAFSLGSHASLEAAKDMLQCCVSLHKSRNVRQKTSPRLPVVLVGTKCDLQERDVTHKEAVETATAFGCTYIETSSALNYNIAEAFKAAVNIAERNRPRSLCGELERSYDCGCSVLEKKIQSSAKKSVKGLLNRIRNFRKEKELLKSLRPSESFTDLQDIYCGKSRS